MNIDRIQAFCQLAKDGNYRVAADNLCITQSALTKKIKRLEEETNTLLFERGRQGAVITQAGQALLSDAQHLINRFSDFQKLSACVSEGSRGHLNIGFGISTYRQAPDAIARFKNRYPNIHITLNDIPSLVQREKLLSGELHLSFNRLHNIEKPLMGIKLFSDRLAIAVHKSEQIDRNNIWSSLSHLNYLQLTPSRGPGLHQQIHAYLADKKQPLTATQEANDILTLLALVSSKLGFTLIPSSAKEIGRPDIKLIPLNEEPACWDVGLIWNTDKINPARDRFIDNVKTIKPTNC
ncbi:LysR family transcriptional regulator [Vibrio salinus]|uniref:LysR family transcriptional regulator n=1 Tax=Vibrio salinus TaxID=2899784 RepID=UPI001E401E73|nr:LysR family transcriptional regulator [Vibrio salinus]MCE0495550.1 LysR family transcriptional regulator [Vibrio salinus]